MNYKNVEYLKLFDKIKSSSIHFSLKEKRITSSKGKSQNWMIDLRPVLLDATSIEIICEKFWGKYESYLPFQIGGMAVAAVPLVTALLISANRRGLSTSGFIIRKTRKRTGLGNRIEGKITDAPIILVDDIFNSGSSMQKAYQAVQQEGLSVSAVFAIIDYESKTGKTWLRVNGTKIQSIFKLKDFDLKLWSNPKSIPTKYKILWRYAEPGAFPYHVVPKSTPLVVGDSIYMGTDIGKFICIDRLSGKKKWDFDVETSHPKGIWSSPAYHEGCIYFGAYNGSAYCLSAEDGTLVWKNPCCDFIGSSPLIVSQHNMMFLGLEHQRPRMMGSNAAFDLKTSNRIWEVAQKKYQHGSAVYDPINDSIIFGNANHDITSYQAKTGKLKWQTKTGRSTKYPPAIDTDLGIVVAASFDGNIYILDSTTGELRFKIKTKDICYTTPLIHQGKVFVGSGDKHFYVINGQDGRLVEKINCKARIYSSPKIIDYNIIFGTSGGKIIELDPNNYKIISEFTLPDAITNAISSSSDNKIIYASTCMNEIYAIRRA